MFNVEITFAYRSRRDGWTGQLDESAVAAAVYGVLGAWKQNGQLLPGEFPRTIMRTCCRVVATCPETNSLEPRYAGKDVREAVAGLAESGLREPAWRLLGEDLDSPVADKCRKPTWYILSADCLSNAPPVQCGECHEPIPLYRLPSPVDPGKVLYWHHTYRAMDFIQLGSGTGERFALKQMADPNSFLSRDGREICRVIEKATGVPTYYYLQRVRPRSLAAEKKSVCPSCGRKWLLAKPLHGRYDFKCDRCRLLSNIACSARGR